MKQSPSYNQLLTVQYQLHKLLFNENLDQCEERRTIDTDSLEEDDYRRIESEVYDLANEWISRRKDRQDLLSYFGPGSKSTLTYLREKIPEWMQFENEYPKRSFFREVAEKISQDEAEKYQILDTLLIADQREEELQYFADEHIRKYLKIIKKEHDSKNLLAKQYFPDACTNKKKPWSTTPKWMLNYKPLREEIQKKRGKRLFDIMNHLWEKKLSYTKSQKMLPPLLDNQHKNRFRKLPVANTTGTEGRKINKHLARKSALDRWKERTDVESTQWILVQPDPTALAVELGVATITINKDLKRLERAGALIQLGKPGPNDHLVYVIGEKGGTFNDSKGEVQHRGKKPFLKEKLRDRLLRALTE